MYLKGIDANGNCTEGSIGITWTEAVHKLSAWSGSTTASALIDLADSNSLSSITPSYVNIPTVSSLNKTIENGTVSGLIDPSGDLIGTYNGSSETAPKHTIIRYFIKAL